MSDDPCQDIQFQALHIFMEPKEPIFLCPQYMKGKVLTGEPQLPKLEAHKNS